MKTSSELFVERRFSEWMKLYAISEKIKRGKVHSLTESELRDFPKYYRLACSDLAEARARKLSSDVINYINSIVGQAHKCIYMRKPLQRSQIFHFFSRVLPLTVFSHWKYFLASFIIFFGSMSTTLLTGAIDPESVIRYIPREFVAMMEEMHGEAPDLDRDAGKAGASSAFYIQNNTSIAFLCFAGGIFFGIGTVYFLLTNGLTIGGIAGYLTGRGKSAFFWQFVTAHSAFELTGIVLAGAAGLLLGMTLLKATRSSRGHYFKTNRDNILTLVAAGALCIGHAAFIEAIISPSSLDYSIKAAVAIFCAVFLIAYFVVYPAILRVKGKVINE